MKSLLELIGLAVFLLLVTGVSVHYKSTDLPKLPETFYCWDYYQGSSKKWTGTSCRMVRVINDSDVGLKEDAEIMNLRYCDEVLSSNGELLGLDCDLCSTC